jgi:outer membrane protein assembly factor BamE (lipoprotein component of BamABCDE complex)
VTGGFVLASRRWAVLGCAIAVSACADPPATCTIYKAKGFSEEAFAKIEKGMTRAEVEERIGPGVHENSRVRSEMWFYGDPREAAQAPFPVIVFDESGAVTSVSRTDRVTVGMERSVVEGLMGKPQRRSPGGRLTLVYYTAPGDCPGSGFPAREVALGPDDRVAWTWAGWIQEGPGGEFETEPPLDDDRDHPSEGSDPP